MQKSILESCFLKTRMRYESMFLKFRSIANSIVVSGKKSKIASNLMLQKFKCEFALAEFVFTTKYMETSFVKVKPSYVCRIETEDDETPVFALIDVIILNEDTIFLDFKNLQLFGFEKRNDGTNIENEKLFTFVFWPSEFNQLLARETEYNTHSSCRKFAKIFITRKTVCLVTFQR